LHKTEIFRSPFFPENRGIYAPSILERVLSEFSKNSGGKNISVAQISFQNRVFTGFKINKVRKRGFNFVSQIGLKIAFISSFSKRILMQKKFNRVHMYQIITTEKTVKFVCH